jgi:hypothetical protein
MSIYRFHAFLHTHIIFYIVSHDNFAVELAERISMDGRECNVINMDNLDVGINSLYEPYIYDSIVYTVRDHIICRLKNMKRRVMALTIVVHDLSEYKRHIYSKYIDWNDFIIRNINLDRLRMELVGDRQYSYIKKVNSPTLIHCMYP